MKLTFLFKVYILNKNIVYNNIIKLHFLHYELHQRLLCFLLVEYQPLFELTLLKHTKMEVKSIKFLYF